MNSDSLIQGSTKSCGCLISAIERDAKDYFIKINENFITQHVYDFLDARIQTMLDAGIAKNRIMIDPGFGFGKTMPQNYQLLAEMSVLKNLDAPILIGVSRKSMIGYATNQTVENRTVGSVVAALAAADRGAVVLRVHDVQATRDGLNVWNAINKELNHGS